MPRFLSSTIQHHHHSSPRQQQQKQHRYHNVNNFYEILTSPNTNIGVDGIKISPISSSPQNPLIKAPNSNTNPSTQETFPKNPGYSAHNITKDDNSNVRSAYFL